MKFVFVALSALAVAQAVQCESNAQCTSAEYCGSSSGTAGECTTLKTAGSNCNGFDFHDWVTDSNGDSCASGLKCVNGVCTVPKANGQACTSSDECTSSFCSVEIEGSGATHTCQARVAADGSCTDGSIAPSSPQCVDGYYCDGVLGQTKPVSGSGTCKAKKAQGSACTYSLECSGLTPQCTENKCDDPFGNAVAGAVALAGGLLAAIIIIPLVVCICCCVAIFFLMKKKKSSDDD